MNLLKKHFKVTKISEALKNIVNTNSETPAGIDRLFLNNIAIDKIKDLLDEDTAKKIENLNSIYMELQEIYNYFSSLMNEEFDISSLDKIEERIESYKRISKNTILTKIVY